MIRHWLAEVHEKLLDYYGLLAFFAIWEIAPKVGWIDSQFIPPPSVILSAAWKLAVTGDLFIHAATSLQRTLLGLFFALATSVPLGFILAGWFPRLTRFMNPLLQLLGNINAFSLFPLFILFFGIGELAKFSIIYWSTIWPVFFTTVSGVQNVDPLLIRSARAMGANRFTVFSKVVLPGAAPSIFTGFRMGATRAFLMLIAAEMVGASAGLGWLVHNSSMNYVIPRLFVAVVTIALLGMGLNYLISLLESTLITWKEEVNVD